MATAPRKRIRADGLGGLRMRAAKACFAGLFGVILAALVNIQVVNHARFQREVMRQEFLRVEEPVPRGAILDRNGKPLALSLPSHALYLDYWRINRELAGDPSYTDRLVRELAEALGAPRAELERRMKPPYPRIRRDLAREEYEKLQGRRLPGVVLPPSHSRVYPCGRLACHVVGYAGSEDNGQEGIELLYDGLLSGTPGISQVVRDGEGKLIPSLERVIREPRPGTDLVLTIDYAIQAIVEEEIAKVCEASRPAAVSVVVMDPRTGEILALANRPDFDLNEPGKVMPASRRNRAVTDLFEPGSVFKIVTAAAAFEEGLITPQERIFCHNGEWSVRGHVLHDVHRYGTLSVEDIVVKSSNIGTVKIALDLGDDALYRYCRAFGFGATTGVDLPGEIRGILRPLPQWSGYSITAVPIGQEVGITSLQGIRAMAAIANGGFLVKPHLLKETRSPDGKREEFSHPAERVISGATAETVSAILEKVVGPDGTAPLAAIPGYRVCGKTGTAQKVVDGRYSMTKVVSSFVGYVVNGRPDIIIAINVDEPAVGQFGGVIAGPAFRNIAWRVMQYWRVPPDEHLQRLQVARQS